MPRVWKEESHAGAVGEDGVARGDAGRSARIDHAVEGDVRGDLAGVEGAVVEEVQQAVARVAAERGAAAEPPRDGSGDCVTDPVGVVGEHGLGGRVDALERKETEVAGTGNAREADGGGLGQVADDVRDAGRPIAGVVALRDREALEESVGDVGLVGELHAAAIDDGEGGLRALARVGEVARDAGLAGEISVAEVAGLEDLRQVDAVLEGSVDKGEIETRVGERGDSGGRRLCVSQGTA